MARGVSIAAAQVRNQQLLAAKNVKREKAPVAVITVKMVTLLAAVDAVVGRVEIEDQLGRCGRKRSNERLDEDLMKGGDGAMVDDEIGMTRIG